MNDVRKQMKMISTRADAELILRIARRAATIAKDAGIPHDAMSFAMDITAVHLNGCPLDLPALLKADAFNFSHDVLNVRRHLDRSTGKLGGEFTPRYARLRVAK